MYTVFSWGVSCFVVSHENVCTNVEVPPPPLGPIKCDQTGWSIYHVHIWSSPRWLSCRSLHIKRCDGRHHNHRYTIQTIHQHTLETITILYQFYTWTAYIRQNSEKKSFTTLFLVTSIGSRSDNTSTFNKLNNSGKFVLQDNWFNADVKVDIGLPDFILFLY